MFGESAASQELHLVSNADAVVDASKSSFVIKLEQCCPHKGQTLQLHLDATRTFTSYTPWTPASIERFVRAPAIHDLVRTCL
jgi:hypothetical protein